MHKQAHWSAVTGSRGCSDAAYQLQAGWLQGAKTATAERGSCIEAQAPGLRPPWRAPRCRWPHPSSCSVGCAPPHAHLHTLAASRHQRLLWPAARPRMTEQAPPGRATSTQAPGHRAQVSFELLHSVARSLGNVCCNQRGRTKARSAAQASRRTAKQLVEEAGVQAPHEGRQDLGLEHRQVPRRDSGGSRQDRVAHELQAPACVSPGRHCINSSRTSSCV